MRFISHFFLYIYLIDYYKLIIINIVWYYVVAIDFFRNRYQL